MSWPRSGLLLRRKCARIPAFFWIKTSFGLVILIFVLGRSNKGSNRGLLSTLSASVGVGGKKSSGEDTDLFGRVRVCFGHTIVSLEWGRSVKG